VRTGGRQLAIGLAAAAVTFAIGRLIGAEIA
jgi:VIT1/CCC1 family predicted Fe2+/Mn2+ transporter